MAGNQNDKKRKRYDAKMQQGSRKKRRDMGRKEYNRQPQDRRAENETRNRKRQQALEAAGENVDAAGDKSTNGSSRPSVYSVPFTEEEITAEQRRPKHKVAVMIGYSGSGYKGMQINAAEKTIEGDLFAAFVKAGAISKANADDPKKSNLVRCARTDKGVHAAGNVISLKLIVEDPDVVAKINENLSPQIRVWGIQRTTGSFSCYQACDSRWYEYLIPSHAFLPPHPHSFLAKKLRELAEEAGDVAGYEERQQEVSTFWSETEEQHIEPILDSLDEWTKRVVIKHRYDEELTSETLTEADTEADHELPTESVSSNNHAPPNRIERRKQAEAALKRLRAATIAAKRAYRLPASRLSRIDAALAHFHGTRNFHNYTVDKGPRDPSAKRLIRSFTLSPPLLINGTEWLSLRIHGQSFMMHQIRKMVGMLALAVRCGADAGSLIPASLAEARLSIPKAPSVGLLLERPVFDTYNAGPAESFGREKIDFARYEAEMAAFKQREIYERVFGEEEEGNAFHVFFSQVDAVNDGQFLYLSSLGIDAVKRAQGSVRREKEAAVVDSDDEAGAAGAEEGG